MIDCDDCSSEHVEHVQFIWILDGQVDFLVSTNCTLSFKAELRISFYPQLWRSPPCVKKLWLVLFVRNSFILPFWVLYVPRIRGTYFLHPNPILKSEFVLLSALSL